MCLPQWQCHQRMNGQRRGTLPADAPCIPRKKARRLSTLIWMRSTCQKRHLAGDAACIRAKIDLWPEKTHPCSVAWLALSSYPSCLQKNGQKHLMSEGEQEPDLRFGLSQGLQGPHHALVTHMCPAHPPTESKFPSPEPCTLTPI